MLEDILAHLPKDFLWRNSIHCYETITSTNTVLKQMGDDSAPEGTTLIASQQTAGKGRLGRSFYSPSGAGIYMSVLLRPSCSPEQLLHLTCAAACAVRDAVEMSAGFRPGIKWTNDLVYSGRKLAGILTEMKLDADGHIAYAVVGIGTNCFQRSSDFPDEISSMAGSLAMYAQKSFTRESYAAALLESLSRMNSSLLNQKQEILQAYRRDCITLGRQVSIVRGEDIRHGTAVDIDETGSLLVTFENGVTEAVSSGEVSVRGLYHYV